MGKVELESLGLGEAVRDRLRDCKLRGVPGSVSQERTHLVSPEPFALTRSQLDRLRHLGDALLAFYRAANDLYLRPGHDWARSYLDIGKPDDVVRYGRMNFQKRSLPRVIRPDILITDGRFVITELDSVPGGMGHLDCLSAAYEEAGFELVGSPRGVRDRFAAMLRDAAGISDPACAIVVSEESADYLPEMAYLSGELRASGLRVYTIRPDELSFTEEGLWVEADRERVRLDVVYRFYELFDLMNIPKSELVMYAAKKKLVTVTPPYKPYLEEKLLLALLHSPHLLEFWESAIGCERLSMLSEMIAPTWILDNRAVPPHAGISGFEWQGRPIRDWREIGHGTQKQRRLVLKPSGFSPLAWGSRGVKVGHDMSREQWAHSLEDALADFNSSPWVLQWFHDTQILRVYYYNEAAGTVGQMAARVRLCPYYFVTDDRAHLAGVLATACPKDKKLIHGMVDAVITPCRVEEKG